MNRVMLHGTPDQSNFYPESVEIDKTSMHIQTTQRYNILREVGQSLPPKMIIGEYNWGIQFSNNTTRFFAGEHERGY